MPAVALRTLDDRHADVIDDDLAVADALTRHRARVIAGTRTRR